MRKWSPTARRHDGAAAVPAEAMGQIIASLGEEGFEARLLEQLQPVLPAASWSVYQVGPRCAPTLFMSASRGIPDTTRACWVAYLTGPFRDDCTLRFDNGSARSATQLCHITAQEVASEHRARVYEAHGVSERVSVVRHADDDSLFAVNFYRHVHQRALTDGQIGWFEELAPVVLALAQKHVALRGPAVAHTEQPADVLRERLLLHCDALTARELDVCTRLLRGMTQDGIAADLALSLPTVKTYRNRAFMRLGIHFRNELFALVMQRG